MKIKWGNVEVGITGDRKIFLRDELTKDIIVMTKETGDQVVISLKNILDDLWNESV